MAPKQFRTMILIIERLKHLVGRENNKPYNLLESVEKAYVALSKEMLTFGKSVIGRTYEQRLLGLIENVVDPAIYI